MEVRTENEILVDRILHIIREERDLISEDYSEEDEDSEENAIENSGQADEGLENHSPVISPVSV
ncbi:hypothetical protein FNH22_13410 [Fulvivirga sp. M361]|uniref:hypothetical protein n=1 Tax=Fulvivirga sp. M361 TaxID=2594266 RepID=UPI00117AFDB9|nr:hypothetical protein [Fulvivirga sp. M361]TRX58864.1 hypothetical protein FNH22_13410 [Fulvivirga sp. M361]